MTAGDSCTRAETDDEEVEEDVFGMNTTTV